MKRTSGFGYLYNFRHLKADDSYYNRHNKSYYWS